MLLSSDTHESMWLALNRRREKSLPLHSMYIPNRAATSYLESFKLSTSCDNSHESRVMLEYALYLVQDSGLEYVVATACRHNAELGRGYLLLSDAGADGRVWRWEVGGGPIAIGKTLHLDQAGCRSNVYHPCLSNNTLLSHGGQLTGSGGIAIDFYKTEHFTEGRLVIAEWGEGRIARLEENGARTPLVMHVPDVCSTTENGVRRLERPTTLLYTPFGDLLFIDHFVECQKAAMFQLRRAVHTEALSSLIESRKAHAWTAIDSNHASLPHLLYSDESIAHMGGLALTPIWTSVYLSAVKDDSVILLRIPLEKEEDDDDSDDEKAQKVNISTEPQMILNLTQHFPSVKEPGAVAVSREGRVFWTTADGVLVVDPEKNMVLGMIPTPSEPTSIALGEDRFLYLSTKTSLLRIRVQQAPVKVPTNVVV